MKMSDRRTIILSAMMASVGPISMALLTPAMPEMAVEFGATDGAIARTLTFFLCGFAIGQLTVGALADRYGRRPVALIFAAIYMSASFFALFVPNLELLLSARFFQGVGVSSGLVIARAIVRDAYEGQSATRIFSAIALCNAVVPMISPSVGAISSEYLGWHALFAQMALLGASLFTMLLVFQRETLVAANRTVSIEPRRLLRTYGNLLADRSFLAPAVMMGSGIGAIYIISILMPFILIGQLGLSNTSFGLITGLQTLSYIVSALVYNRLHRRWTSATSLRISSCLFFAAAALLGILHLIAPMSALSYMTPIMVWVAGNAVSIPGLTSAALQGFPNRAGAASALLGFIQIAFASLGTLLMEFLPIEPNSKMLLVFVISAAIIEMMKVFRPNS
jgi:DHA1 family bicyclomycin/chloramphenicol resistance-like MFS transporter